MISTGGDLNGPLGVASVHDGLLVANGGNGDLVALSPGGSQLGEKVIARAVAGASSASPSMPVTCSSWTTRRTSSTC